MNRTLDWRSRHDEESKNYGIRQAIGTNVAVNDKLWRPGSVLDQGEEGACVGFGWTADLLANPRPNYSSSARGNKYAFALYDHCKKIDEWAGEDYEGTSVLAGAKAMKQRGFIGEYRWAFSIEDVRDSLITTGPVVIGISWYEGMYQTKPNGLVSVNGSVVGGHCLLLTGYFKAKMFDGQPVEVVQWRNSWGKEYGINGDGWIRLSDLALLLRDNGEACIPVDRKRVKLIV